MFNAPKLLATVSLITSSASIYASSSGPSSISTSEQKPSASSQKDWTTPSQYSAYEPSTGRYYDVEPDEHNGYKNRILDLIRDSPTEFAERRYYRYKAKNRDPSHAEEYEAEQADDNAKMNALWSLLLSEERGA